MVMEYVEVFHVENRVYEYQSEGVCGGNRLLLNNSTRYCTFLAYVNDFM